ncbi:hypothetical protein LguiA_001068 [Lonicera macranthoides]
MEIASAPTVHPHNNWITRGASAFDVIYVPEKSGVYQIRVFCGNIELNSAHPFRKEVSAGEYFPKAYNDVVSVWEDESFAFSTLENDYFAGGNASIVEFSKV